MDNLGRVIWITRYGEWVLVTENTPLPPKAETPDIPVNEALTDDEIPLLAAELFEAMVFRENDWHELEALRVIKRIHRLGPTLAYLVLLELRTNVSAEPHHTRSYQ